MISRKGLAQILLILTGVLVVAAYPWLGTESLKWVDIFNPKSPAHRILFELRLPRLWLSLLAGGVLALLGGSYQSLFNNSLAEPYLLGVSSAVTLGIVAAEIFLGIPTLTVWSAFFGAGAAFAVTVLLLVLSLSRMGQASERLVLFGLGVNFVLSSALFLVLSYAFQHMGGGSQRWLFGQIPWVSLREVTWLTIFSVPFLVGILLLSRGLDALAFGESVARTLGFSAKFVRSGVLVLSCGLLSGMVFYTGSIGFVGLVVPHAVRLLFAPGSSRALMGYSFLVGAVFLAAADLVSRLLLPPFEFPIGIITTLFGGPLFLYLLWVRR